nr:MAG TPA: hypothetical protein [Caudoviricetes sp.]DAR40782.1 MAG TPA: hypothetical protein [Caudoviricetes sp.]
MSSYEITIVHVCSVIHLECLIRQSYESVLWLNPV